MCHTYHKYYCYKKAGVECHFTWYRLHNIAHTFITWIVSSLYILYFLLKKIIFSLALFSRHFPYLLYLCIVVFNLCPFRIKQFLLSCLHLFIMYLFKLICGAHFLIIICSLFLRGRLFPLACTSFWHLLCLSFWILANGCDCF